MENIDRIETDTTAFPASLRGDFHALSCLNWGAGTAAWLCETGTDGERVIVRIADTREAEQRLIKEEEILRMIAGDPRAEAGLFPRPIGLKALEEPPHRLAFIRSFIPGRPLDAVTEAPSARPGLPPEKAVRYVTQVLGQLDFLHHLRPPVIHRDIKPQNVIVDGEDRCFLIDLDIARTQRRAEDADTLVMGTRLTSPPEQYGFRATDVRSDVYSAGVLLRYCLTGEYGPEADASLPADFRRIIAKATRFDPEDRYQSAAEFREALSALYPGPPKSREKKKWMIPLGVLLVLCAFLLGWLTAPGAKVKETRGGTAARTGLRITEDMFDGDQELYRAFQRGECNACAAVITPGGMRIARYPEVVEGLAERERADRVFLSGEELAEYLDALRHSPCWVSSVIIMIVDRDIESLEPFRIQYVGDHFCLEFHRCTLPEDPSPLRALVPYLTDLCCYDGTFVPWHDLDFLRTVNRLNILALPFDGSGEVDLSAFKDLNSPTVLRLSNVFVGAEALSAIARMERLEVLELNNCGLEDVSALAGLENLRELTLNRNLITDLSPLADLPRLERLEAEDNPLRPNGMLLMPESD